MADFTVYNGMDIEALAEVFERSSGIDRHMVLGLLHERGYTMALYRNRWELRSIDTHPKRHSCIVFEREWDGNGARIEVLYYPPPHKPYDDADPSDQMQLIITDGDGTTRGWLFNVEDALTLIEGVSKAAYMAVFDGVPTKPEPRIEVIEVDAA